MTWEEAQNFCPRCGELVPLGAARCPHCARIFHPERKGWLPLYCQCWRLGFTFSGRAPLKEFYAFVIPHALLLLWAFCYMVNGAGVSLFGNKLYLCSRMWNVLCTDKILQGIAIFFLLALVPSLALLVRRVHDFGFGMDELHDEAAIEQDESDDDWWTIWRRWRWRVSMLLIGPLGWLVLLIERYFGGHIGVLLFLPIRAWHEDSIPGPNEHGPGTRYPRFTDAPVGSDPFN